ncbi:MAG: ATP-grasp domain-containing protein, partial [Sporichthyaceae bacterium]|nr:ATP-grasp domain-containing protein [Sporichthyaceae bacterium]
MSETREEVILAGISVRALAQSAWRTGYAVHAVDAFGDRDLAECARTTLGLVRDLATPYSARAAAEAALGWNRPVAGVAYGSGFENHPDAVAILARGRVVWGNRPDVLTRVRDPLRLGRVLRRLGFPAPAVRASPPTLTARAWLRKPRRSGGGQGIAIWDGGPVPRDQVLQERIEGVPGSVSFLADGRRAAMLGLSAQLVGDPAFGSTGYRYCGSVIAPGGPALFDRQETVWSGAAALVSTLTVEFGLVGLNGVDFIAQDGVPY